MEQVMEKLDGFGVEYTVNERRDIISLGGLAICADPVFDFFWLGEESGTGGMEDVLGLVDRLYG